MDTLRELYNKEVALVDNKLRLMYKNENGQAVPDSNKWVNIDISTFKNALKEDDEFFYNLLFFVKDKRFQKEYKDYFFKAYQDLYYPPKNNNNHKNYVQDTSQAKSDQRKLIFYASSILLNKNDGDRFDQIVFSIKYAIKNQFFFDRMEIDREEFINEIIWKDKEKREFHPFIKNHSKQNDLGWKILKFLLTNWYLPRYDLETTGQIIKALKPEKNKLDIWKIFTTFIISNWKQIAVITFFAFFFFFINDKNIHLNLKLPLTYNELVSDNGGYNWKNISSIVFVSFSYFLVTWHFIVICCNRLKINLYIPRLLAAIVIGYLPLFVAKDVWEFGMSLPSLIVLVLILLCLVFAFVYLFYEVNNRVENHKVARLRVLKIFLRSIIYSIISGTIISDLTCGTYIHDCKPEVYNNIYMGFFGVIDPKVLLVFFPLALLIGIFVQIIWEDKPITQPL